MNYSSSFVIVGFGYLAFLHKGCAAPTATSEKLCKARYLSVPVLRPLKNSRPWYGLAGMEEAAEWFLAQ